MKHKNIYNRLRRIEGQVRGLEEMLDKDRPERDILIQLEAAKSSLGSTISSLIESMLEKNQDGGVVLTEKEVSTLMRFIKKN